MIPRIFNLVIKGPLQNPKTADTEGNTLDFIVIDDQFKSVTDRRWSVGHPHILILYSRFGNIVSSAPLCFGQLVKLRVRDPAQLIKSPTARYCFIQPVVVQYIIASMIE